MSAATWWSSLDHCSSPVSVLSVKVGVSSLPLLLVDKPVSLRLRLLDWISTAVDKWAKFPWSRRGLHAHTLKSVHVPLLGWSKNSPANLPSSLSITVFSPEMEGRTALSRWGAALTSWSRRWTRLDWSLYFWNASIDDKNTNNQTKKVFSNGSKTVLIVRMGDLLCNLAFKILYTI